VGWRSGEISEWVGIRHCGWLRWLHEQMQDVSLTVTPCQSATDGYSNHQYVTSAMTLDAHSSTQCYRLLTLIGSVD